MERAGPPSRGQIRGVHLRHVVARRRSCDDRGYRSQSHQQEDEAESSPELEPDRATHVLPFAGSVSWWQSTPVRMEVPVGGYPGRSRPESRGPERLGAVQRSPPRDRPAYFVGGGSLRSEEHTSELQSRQYLVCRLLLEKKKK